MASPKLIRTGWEHYRKEVMPPEAGQTQVLECRRAFYAGAMTMFSLMEKVSDLEEDRAVAMFQVFQKELKEFCDNVGKGL